MTADRPRRDRSARLRQSSASRSHDGRQSLTVIALAITQIIGWGTTYYLPAVIDDRLSNDLGLSRDVVFGGVSAMLMIGAIAGPAIGKLIDRIGAARILALGSSLMAAGLAVLSIATDGVMYFAAWILFGLGVPTALSIPAIALLTERAGGQARRAIGMLLLFTGLAATIAWPLTSWLAATIGWRGTCVAFALVHIGVCLPLHLLLARYVPGPADPGVICNAGVPAAAEGMIGPAWRRLGLLLAAVTFSLQGFVSWGLTLQLISVFESFGMTMATATAIAALMGPAAVGARLLEVGFGHRVSPLLSVAAGTVVLPLTFILLLVGQRDTLGAIAFVIIYSAANGLVSIARATLPLALFGPSGFGELLGKLSLPQHLVFAASPIAFAAMIDRAGLDAALWVALLCELAACATLFALISLTMRR